MREQHLQSLEVLMPVVMKQVQARPGITVDQLRTALSDSPSVDVATLALVGTAIVHLWDAGKLEITSSRGLQVPPAAK